MVRTIVRFILLWMIVYSFASVVYIQTQSLFDTTEPDEAVALELIEIYED